MNRFSEDLEERIGYRFHDASYLTDALTHSSYANEAPAGEVRDYERLEFLGDAVLEMISSEYLFKKHPEMSEGELTKKRASLVREEALSLRAETLLIPPCVRLGKGEEKGGGRHRPSIMADVVEAVIGAIFLDGGVEEAKKFILRFVLSDETELPGTKDYKTKLQELVQTGNLIGYTDGELSYEVEKEIGPEHDKIFFVAAYIGGKRLGFGEGRNKKAAEQQAAMMTLKMLRQSPKAKTG